MIARSLRTPPVLAALLGLAVAPWTASARGDDRQSAALGKAEEATAAYNIGRFEGAAKLWEEAYLLVQDPNFLFNIGQSYRQAGKPESALTAYRACLRTAPVEAPYRELARKRIAELEQHRAMTAPLPATPAPVELRAPPPPPPEKSGSRWAIWAAVGAVVIGGAVAAFVLTRDPTEVPTTKLGGQRAF